MSYKTDAETTGEEDVAYETNVIGAERQLE